MGGTTNDIDLGIEGGFLAGGTYFFPITEKWAGAVYIISEEYRLVFFPRGVNTQPSVFWQTVEPQPLPDNMTLVQRGIITDYVEGIIQSAHKSSPTQQNHMLPDILSVASVIHNFRDKHTVRRDYEADSSDRNG